MAGLGQHQEVLHSKEREEYICGVLVVKFVAKQGEELGTGTNTRIISMGGTTTSLVLNTD